ncbi:MAG: gamma-glutamyltranspeptidase [Polaribacter sp. BACL8 MAG-120531-bin13]|jgi:gamma-glutamyltranspeptidase/glutathione hydrolase|nr:MAG: gamma-glutamyltranspeptidase [Polaribacter sp. BACL8 MAG-120531-bin13]MBT4839792.1 gamma-glutamyltransferase [Flavobacteriaceae bacterium]NQV62522.1 gamma-glutamyltransferase [Cryomorphaceae bacterium]MBT5921341.1 gamma-glutamyltransferase [Flavobacteriaceae bacterium]MDA8810538.1 gamma-glutamyltransferase [Flavobacteriaceae bacterium]|tara:strand:- start:6877 stop:8568 length:1692 start_codon:yes stop_codon:yes gene_type:complete
MKSYLKLPLLFAIIILNVCCKTEVPPSGLVTENAMVVSARQEASAIGSAILARGGNAFDAMVATELALAVAYPFAGNLGGGGFMVYRKANGDVGSIDYREKAPASAHRDLYLDEVGNVIPGMSTLGATAVGVPGTIAGITEVHAKMGSLPFEEILAPVIALAKKGVVVTEKQARSMASQREIIAKISGEQSLFAQNYVAGDTIKYTALANTLTAIAKAGRKAFYEGEMAEKIASFIQERGGFITTEDLANYEAVWRQPVIFNYKDLRIISMSPPSSGGVTMHQIFKMIEPYDIKSFGHNSPEAIQLFTEASRRAYADRNFFLGDPDYSPIPLDVILSNAYLKKRMTNFSFDKATLSSEVSHGDVQIIESEETTHYSIVDQDGNAVSVTTTLNGAFGSKLYSEELGFFFNNEMDDFSAKAGVPNMFGLIGAEANSIEPGKRMLSSMTPTIVEKEGKLWMVVGTPGGSTIITAVAQTILNAYEHGLSMQDAVNAPRFHHQWLPDTVVFEPEGFSKSTLATLKEKGYLINEERSRIIGKVDAIRVLKSGQLEAGADPRGDDAAVGF